MKTFPQSRFVAYRRNVFGIAHIVSMYAQSLALSGYNVAQQVNNVTAYNFCTSIVKFL